MRSLDPGQWLPRVVAAWLALSLAMAAHAQALNQDRVMAALTLQLLSFTEWPAAASTEGGITIGIFDDASLLHALKELLERDEFRGRYHAQLVTSETSRDQLDELHALFFPSGDSRAVAHTIKRLESQPVVLLGAYDGFLESGGMVNFLKKQRRLTFEIDLDRSRASGIAYRAKLLRLADRLIGQ